MSNLKEADVVVDVGGVVVLVADDLFNVDALLDTFIDVKLDFTSICYTDSSLKARPFS